MMENSAMLSPEQAREAVLSHVGPLGAEPVPLLEARNRVLAVDVRADRDNPPYDNSAMDGFAVRYQDVSEASTQRPVALEIVEEIAAGSVAERRIEAGQTARIMTGAPIPEGADTVIPVEDTRPGNGGTVEILDPDDPGANVRPRGEDIKAGSLVLKAGTECRAGEIGLLATLQKSQVSVGRQPKVAILSTGDELVDIDQPLTAGKIVNSNSYALAALARDHGAVPVTLPIVRDSEHEIRQAIDAALEADFVLSSGGVSVGEYDYVKKVLEEMGAHLVFWRVAMKPGKPLLFCLVGDKPYFGLPGNPVSGMMSFLQFVRPAIRRASGYPDDNLLLPTARGLADNPIQNDGNRTNYLRARLRLVDGRFRASVPEGQGSHMLSSMLGANGIVILPPNTVVEAGDEVDLQIIRFPA